MASLYDQMTGTPNYDDILNSNLSREQKAQAIRERGAAYDKSVDKNKWKNIGRAFAGSLVSGTSFHPVLNIPYVGTGIGGALYDLGQGIAEGDKLPELAKRTGRGFVIGETVGAVPYVGKAASKTKVGQAVGNSAPVKAVGEGISKAGEKFANTKLYDALMTDIKAFNPNKQTVYHGSPYDFNKFSNEAIGTGEGAQAHGLGHYAALDKDIADKNYRDRLIDGQNILDEEKSRINNIPLKNTPLNKLDEISKNELAFNKSRGFSYDEMLKNLENKIEHYQKQYEKFSKMDDYAGRAKLYKKTLDRDIEKYNILKENPFDFENTDLIMQPKQGQLYKLSIPKDDVMLREGARLDKQPKIVQDAFNQIRQEYLNLEPLEDNKTLLNYFGDKLGNANDFYEKQATEAAIKVLNGGKLSANEWQYLNNLNYEDLHKLDAYFTNGEDILRRLQNHFYDKNNKEQLAQKILYDKGIKGISYNGGIDGEARVIFNPDDIDIVRKYYNQPGLYEQIIGKQNTGSLVDALLNR